MLWLCLLLFTFISYLSKQHKYNSTKQIELKKAWEKEKKDITITKHLAIIYQELENDEEAQKYFAEALRNCEKKSEREDVLRSMQGRILKRMPASLLLEE